MNADFLAEALIEFPDSTNPTHIMKRQFYIQLRAKGESRKFAAMCADRRPPASGFDDRALMAGAWGGRDIVNPEAADYYRQVAKASGVSTDGKKYCPQLASFPGDPTAWVDSVGDVKRVAELKGMKLEGGVEYTPSGYGEFETSRINPDDYQVAESVVDEAIVSEMLESEEVAEEYQKNPKALSDRKEELTAQFSGRE